MDDAPYFFVFERNQGSKKEEFPEDMLLTNAYRKYRIHVEFEGRISPSIWRKKECNSVNTCNHLTPFEIYYISFSLKRISGLPIVVM